MSDELIKLLKSESNNDTQKQIVISYLQNCGANFVGLGDFKIPLSNKVEYLIGVPTLYVDCNLYPELSPVEEHIVCDIFKVTKVMYINPDIGIGTNLLN